VKDGPNGHPSDSSSVMGAESVFKQQAKASQLSFPFPPKSQLLHVLTRAFDKKKGGWFYPLNPDESRVLAEGNFN